MEMHISYTLTFHLLAAECWHLTAELLPLPQQLRCPLGVRSRRPARTHLQLVALLSEVLPAFVVGLCSLIPATLSWRSIVIKIQKEAVL